MKINKNKLKLFLENSFNIQNGSGNSDESLDFNNINLLPKLFEALADEWLATWQYFTEVRVIENSQYKPFIIKELKQHAIEEYKHAGMIANRIMELNNKIITDPFDLFSNSRCGLIEPKNSNSLQIIKEAIQGEMCAIKSYTEIADFAYSLGDIKTYDMFKSIIDDEIEHEKDLNKLIIDYNLNIVL